VLDLAEPTRVLMHEHRAVERVVGVLEKAATAVRDGGEPDVRLFEMAVDFFRNFTDCCHHGKEEQALFPALEKKAVRRERGPIGVMLSEHDEGRARIAGMLDALAMLKKGDEPGRDLLVREALAYAEMIRAHIEKEDGVLFPLAERLLDDSEKRAMVERFGEIEREHMGGGARGRYQGLIEEIERLAGS